MNRLSSSVLVCAMLLLGCGDATGPDSVPLRYQEVAAGNGFTCALDRDGLPWCWGLQTQARLGTDRASEPCDGSRCLRPVPVTDPVPMRELTAGESHACGLAVGTVFCWGWNRFGQLGDDRTAIDRCRIEGVGSLFPCAGAPTPAAIGLPLLDASAGSDHTCVLARSGAAYCWGRNRGGQLGTDAAGDSTALAEAVHGDVRFSGISAGLGHTCGIASADSVAYCWGAGASGRLGTGDSETRLTPTRTFGDYRLVAIDAGGGHTCAVTAEGRVRCWGWGGGGQLGIGDRISRVVPAPVLLPDTFVAVSAGYTHSCAVTAQGDLYCWGANASGQIGDGGTADALLPVRIDLGEPVRSVSAGFDHTCAVTDADRLYCWGGNGSGQLGVGGTGSTSTPVRVGA